MSIRLSDTHRLARGILIAANHSECGCLEYLDDSPAAIRAHHQFAYREVLAGKRDGKSLWRELKASNQYGVTRGPLAVIA